MGVIGRNFTLRIQLERSTTDSDNIGIQETSQMALKKWLANNSSRGQALDFVLLVLKVLRQTIDFGS